MATTSITNEIFNGKPAEEFKRLMREFPYVALELDYLRKNQQIMTQSINRLTSSLNKMLPSGEDAIKPTEIFIKAGGKKQSPFEIPTKMDELFQQHMKQVATREER